MLFAAPQKTVVGEEREGRDERRTRSQAHSVPQNVGLQDPTPIICCHPVCDEKQFPAPLFVREGERIGPRVSRRDPSGPDLAESFGIPVAAII